MTREEQTLKLKGAINTAIVALNDALTAIEALEHKTDLLSVQDAEGRSQRAREGRKINERKT